MMANVSFKGVIVCGRCGAWFGDLETYEEHSLQHNQTAPAIKGSASSLSRVAKPRDVCTANRCSRRTHGACKKWLVYTRSHCGAHVAREVVDGGYHSALLYNGYGRGEDILFVPDDSVNDVDATCSIDDILLAKSNGSGIREPGKDFECVRAYYRSDSVGNGRRRDGYEQERYACSGQDAYLYETQRYGGYEQRYTYSEQAHDYQNQKHPMYHDVSSTELHSLMGNNRVSGGSILMGEFKDAGVDPCCSTANCIDRHLCPQTVKNTMVGCAYGAPLVQSFNMISGASLDLFNGLYPYLPYSLESGSSSRSRDILDDYLDDNNKGLTTADNGVFITPASCESFSGRTHPKKLFPGNLEDCENSVSKKEVIFSGENMTIDYDKGEDQITYDQAHHVDGHANWIDDHAHWIDDHDQIDDHAHQVDGDTQTKNVRVYGQREVANPSHTDKTCSFEDMDQEVATAHAGSEEGYTILYDGFTLCHVCGRTFLSGPAMRRHMRNHEKPRNLSKEVHVASKCELCAKTYKSRSSLDRHVSIIHLGRRISCPECLGTFSTVPSLKRHSKIHSRQKGKSQDLLCPLMNR